MTTRRHDRGTKVTERVACLVPFCRRTTARFRPPTEWLCQDHWKLVPMWLKSRRRKVRRLAKKVEDRFLAAYTAQGQTYTAGQHIQVCAAMDLAEKVWVRCKTVAIERAAGITA